ncbi:hypothetical protein CN639_31370 [Bacillus toyonensis]|uniref:hypothetical protein n=1 Tax=Bacillus toyonensis TaxID=155322 RepID=UPI000BF079EA|nr:hypothetical protein [Bacillus toyonensis]PEM79174.1 hypothetical protein CN639_31370 [Bacillus toyonensis]
MEKKNLAFAQINLDMKETRENIKKLTLAANECVDTLAKLEKVMNRFIGQGETVELNCEDKIVEQPVIKQTIDTIKMTAIDL